jgi:hypothetical protein
MFLKGSFAVLIRAARPPFQILAGNVLATVGVVMRSNYLSVFCAMFDTLPFVWDAVFMEDLNMGQPEVATPAPVSPAPAPAAPVAMPEASTSTGKSSWMTWLLVVVVLVVVVYGIYYFFLK